MQGRGDYGGLCGSRRCRAGVFAAVPPCVTQALVLVQLTAGCGGRLLVPVCGALVRGGMPQPL
jgi:hypothetical protein